MSRLSRAHLTRRHERHLRLVLEHVHAGRCPRRGSHKLSLRAKLGVMYAIAMRLPFADRRDRQRLVDRPSAV